MFCLQCGTPYEEGDAFCEGCGQRIDAPKFVACVHCGQLSDDPDAFCEFCGKKVGDASGGAPLPASAPMGFSGFTPPTAPLSQPQRAHSRTAPISQPRIPQTVPSKSTSQPRMLLVFLLDASVTAAPYMSHLLICLSRFIMDVSDDSVSKSALDMAVVQFNDSFKVLDDLPDISKSQPTAEGGAGYSAPIREALRMTEEHSNAHAQTHKPWVIMITSNKPSDDIAAIAGELQSKQRADKLRFMALGVMGYDPAALKTLTDVVFRLKEPDFTSFFEWVGKCVKAIVRTGAGGKPQLPPLEGNVYRDK